MKLNVAVLFGSASVEHEISIITAIQAMNALDQTKYTIIPIYIHKDLRMYTGDGLKEIKNYKDIPTLLKNAKQVMLTRKNQDVVLMPVHAGLFQNKPISTIDVALPILHGTHGEDGSIQGLFEMLNLPYTGSDLYGAVLGQDKVFQKQVLQQSQLPVTHYFWVYAHEMDTRQQDILQQVHKLIYPVILKPARTGSSIGITIAHNDEEFIQCFDTTRQYDDKILIEKVVKPMVEINCSVLGDQQECLASPLEQVGSNHELLDFNDKYPGSKGMASSSRIVPAPLDPETTNYIQNLAKKVFYALGVSGVCRIDFMMDTETKKIYVNEVNTIPGSLAFYLWQEANIPFSDLLDRMLKLALDRARYRSRIIYSYDTNILSQVKLGGTKGSKL